MDKELQKNILKIFIDKKHEFVFDENFLINKIHEIYGEKICKGEKVQMPYTNDVKKQINMLIDNESLTVVENKNSYRLTKWGELRVKGNFFEKFWYWLIYRKHNLSVLISIVSLILSIVTLILSKFTI